MTGTRTVNEEAVLISLDAQGLDDAVYQAYDLSTLEDLLSEQIGPDDIGELDGHEIGPSQTTIYLYGSDAVRRSHAVMARRLAWSWPWRWRIWRRPRGPAGQSEHECGRK